MNNVMQGHYVRMLQIPQQRNCNQRTNVQLQPDTIAQLMSGQYSTPGGSQNRY